MTSEKPKYEYKGVVLKKTNISKPLYNRLRLSAGLTEVDYPDVDEEEIVELPNRLKFKINIVKEQLDKVKDVDLIKAADDEKTKHIFYKSKEPLFKNDENEKVVELFINEIHDLIKKKYLDDNFGIWYKDDKLKGKSDKHKNCKFAISWK